jgi:creatinine amidohydrolase
MSEMSEENRPPDLERLSWTEARDVLMLSPVGFLPVGAIEAHGPHLPLDTDVIIARGMARAAGAALRQSGIPSLILPAVSYSVSFAGSCFPGTTPVTAEALTGYMAEVLIHSAAQGYRTICVCNAHLEPVHFHAVAEAVARANEESDIPIVLPDKRSEEWAVRLGEEFQRGSRHAGCYETSIVMAESPDSIRRAYLEELEPVWIDLPAALRSGARDFAEAGATQGYFGDPRSATAERGIELLEVLGEMIRDHVLEALAHASRGERS